MVRNERRTRLAVIIMAVIVPCLAFCLWWGWHLSPPVQITEIPRAELVLRDGHLYRTGQSQPFIGAMVEFYPNGSLRSRSFISNGLLQGISEGWHTNGQLEVREHFSAGVSQGVRDKWYATGAKLSHAMIVGGQLHGTFQRWYEDGTLAEQVEMRNGNPEGLSLAYYPSGYLKAHVRLQAGKTMEKNFWEDGKTKVPIRETTN